MTPPFLALSSLSLLSSLLYAGSTYSTPLTPSSEASIAGASTTFAAPSSRSFPRWVRSINSSYSNQFSSDLDQGGDFSVSRHSHSLGYSRAFTRQRLVGLFFEYGAHDYDFDNSPTNLWGDVQTFKIFAPIRWKFNEHWNLIARTSINSRIENGASFSDGISGSFLGALSYKLSDRLRLGPGITLNTSLEESTSIVPIILLQWDLTDSLRLETGRGYGVSPGPALNLSWQATDNWKATLGVQYERLEFRLDDRGSAPGGVGEESGASAYVAFDYKPHSTFKATLFAGIKFANDLIIDDSNGQETFSSSLDPAPFVGASLRIRF